MSFLDKIKKLFSIKLPEHFHLHFNLITINKSDQSRKVEYNDSSKKLTVNVDGLDGQEEPKIKELLNLAINEDYALLEENAKVLMEDFERADKSFETQNILKFLKPKIPVDDLNIWRAALYLKNKHESTRKEEVKSVKRQIMQKYGDRGKNIANLCSADYVKDYMIPLYDALIQYYKDESVARERFRKAYSIIVEELPFTIFVNHQMTINDIKTEINRRRKYGSKFINIHGISEDNKRKIQEVSSELETTGKYEIKKYIKEEKNIIFVTVRNIESSD
jgi:hypothetical protein